MLSTDDDTDDRLQNPSSSKIFKSDDSFDIQTSQTGNNEIQVQCGQQSRKIVGLLGVPGCRILNAHTDVHREFMHIVLKSNVVDFTNPTTGKPKKPIITCDTYEGPFQTKWSLHFYPEGHPSNYQFNPDLEWFPSQNVPDDQRYASLYVRLKDGPYEMIEARMMTSVLDGKSDIDTALTTNMERFMQYPRMKVGTVFRLYCKQHNKLTTSDDSKSFYDALQNHNCAFRDSAFVKKSFSVKCSSSVSK